MMRRGTFILVLATAPWACVIDGVPLPDETEEGRDSDQAPTADLAGVDTLFATRSAGVILVFGLEGTVPGNATVQVISGDRKASTSAAEDGSFNIALTGDLGSTINVSVVVASKQIGTTTIQTPVPSTILVPDGTEVAADAPNYTVGDSTRADANDANVIFPAGSFGASVAVAIANLDLGTTTTAHSAADGSLNARVKAQTGDTLYVVALARTGASSPYIITAP